MEMVILNKKRKIETAENNVVKAFMQYVEDSSYDNTLNLLANTIVWQLTKHKIIGKFEFATKELPGNTIASTDGKSIILIDEKYLKQNHEKHGLSLISSVCHEVDHIRTDKLVGNHSRKANDQLDYPADFEIGRLSKILNNHFPNMDDFQVDEIENIFYRKSENEKKARLAGFYETKELMSIFKTQRPAFTKAYKFTIANYEDNFRKYLKLINKTSPTELNEHEQYLFDKHNRYMFKLQSDYARKANGDEFVVTNDFKYSSNINYNLKASKLLLKKAVEQKNANLAFNIINNPNFVHTEEELSSVMATFKNQCDIVSTTYMLDNVDIEEIFEHASEVYDHVEMQQAVLKARQQGSHISLKALKQVEKLVNNEVKKQVIKEKIDFNLSFEKLGINIQ